MAKTSQVNDLASDEPGKSVLPLGLMCFTQARAPSAENTETKSGIVRRRRFVVLSIFVRCRSARNRFFIIVDYTRKDATASSIVTFTAWGSAPRRRIQRARSV